MISKYFLWTSVLIVNILLFSSCLGSSDNIEYPTDPQIYSLSLSSRADTASLLPGVAFTIDQVNGKIFNKKPLPYKFHVDSVKLSITSNPNNYYTFAAVEIGLFKPDSDKDSMYYWRESDSIAIPRLRKIKTTAADGKTQKEYDFQLNIHQADPYIISWQKIEGNYIAGAVESQKTVAFDNKFFTYYRSGGEIKAVYVPISEAANKEKWVSINNIPNTLTLSSLIATENTLYAMDATTGNVYRSSNGSSWEITPTQTDYEVVALYGELPFTTPGNILVVVNHQGELKFGQANTDFSNITPMNRIPDNLPVKDFSAIKVESGISYATKFIFLSGGTTNNNIQNNDIWVLQQDNGIIKHIVSNRPEDGTIKGSSLFFYDNQPYLVSSSSGKNILMYSENWGLHWIKSGENQSFPSNFTVRTNASVITDTNHYIWIFGGISSTNTQIVDIWRGRLNKFILN